MRKILLVAVKAQNHLILEVSRVINMLISKYMQNKNFRIEHELYVILEPINFQNRKYYKHNEMPFCTPCSLTEL